MPGREKQNALIRGGKQVGMGSVRVRGNDPQRVGDKTLI